MLRIAPVAAPELACDDAWWRLYEASFPSSELEPRSVILDSVSAGRALAVRALDDGATVGLGAAYLLQRMPFVFVAYLAVHAQARKQGLGSRLLAAMGDLGAERLKRTGLDSRGSVLEVDDPDQAPTPGERLVREKRIRFFEAQGARLVETSYLQPPLDGETVVPMRLMVISRPPWQPFPNPASRDLIRAMYLDKYAVTNGLAESLLDDLLNRFPSDAPPSRSLS